MIVPSVWIPAVWIPAVPAGGRETFCGSVRSVAGASRRHLLARTASRSLAGDHDATFEDLAAPDTPWLATVEGAGQARRPHGAVGAEALGELQLGRALGEPQLRVLDPARQGSPRRGRGQRRPGPSRGGAA